MVDSDKMVTLGGRPDTDESILSRAPIDTVETHSLLDGSSSWLAPMIRTRADSCACALTTTSIMVCGGTSPGLHRDAVRGTSYTAMDCIAAAEVLDLQTGVWSSLPPMLNARSLHIMVKLRDGRVLVAGGQTDDHEDFGLDAAEVYDPATNKWQAIAPMNECRWHHAAYRCLPGRVE